MILAFVAGALVEFAWLAWIYFAGRGWPLRTAAASMAIGGLGFVGLHAGLEGHPVALVCGYGLGSYAGAWAKRKLGGK